MLLFFDASRLAREFAQVIKFGATDCTAANDFDFVDTRRMHGENSFDADAVGNSADGEHFAHAAALTTDNHAFKNLNAFAVAFNDFCMDAHGVAGSELRNVFAKLFAFQKFDDIQVKSSNLFDVRARTQRNAFDFGSLANLQNAVNVRRKIFVDKRGDL